MNRCVRITVLVENTVHRQGLVAEHGLSFHVEVGSQRLLFDTGQTDLATINAKALGLDLSRLEAVVLSHGHYDHTGGVPAVLNAAADARVLLHPSAWQAKYSKSPDGRARCIGMSDRTGHALLFNPGGCTETPGWMEIVEGVYVTGEIPRSNPYEDTGGPFFLDDGCTQPDPLADDQALVIDRGPSVVLLLGCAHAGVVNTLEHVQHMAGGKPVRALIGGLHLGSASEERFEKTLARLRATRLDCLAPMHCTGWPATARLWQAMPEIYRSAGVGTVFEF